MNPLKSVTGTIIAGFVLSIIILLLTGDNPMTAAGAAKGSSILIWLHVFAGIIWIGILYYFNFIQVPALAEALADDGGPGGAGITKYVAPRALFWFRWASLATWLTGAAFLLHSAKGSLGGAFMLGMGGENVHAYNMTIGIGAWLGTIMLFNVWVLIWPNQKKILGMVEASADEIAAAKKIAFAASRTNTLLSIPLIMSMVGAGHGFFM
jgi:uncharacterized membrane protein